MIRQSAIAETRVNSPLVGRGEPMRVRGESVEEWVRTCGIGSGS